MTPRRLAPHDPALPGVQRLVAEAFPPGSDAPSAGLGRADLAARVAAGPALVTERDGVPIGCVLSRPSDFRPGALYIGTLVVAPAARGAGQARALIAAMSEEARSTGFTGLVVAVETADLVAFYEHLGFTWFRDGTGCVVLHRPLPG